MRPSYWYSCELYIHLARTRCLHIQTAHSDTVVNNGCVKTPQSVLQSALHWLSERSYSSQLEGFQPPSRLPSASPFTIQQCPYPHMRPLLCAQPEQEPGTEPARGGEVVLEDVENFAQVVLAVLNGQLKTRRSGKNRRGERARAAENGHDRTLAVRWQNWMTHSL